MSDDKNPPDGPEEKPYRSFAEELDGLEISSDGPEKTPTLEKLDDQPEKEVELPEPIQEFNMPTPGGDEVRRQTNEAKFFPENGKSRVEALDQEPVDASLSQTFERAGRERGD